MKAASSPSRSTLREPRTTSSAASRRPTTIRPFRAASISATASSTPAPGPRGLDFGGTRTRRRPRRGGRDRLVRRHQADVEFAARHHEPRLRRSSTTHTRAPMTSSPSVDYVEFKAGYSWSALHPSLVTGTTVYYSPDYFVRDRARCGRSKRWPLGRCRSFHVFTPVINGVLGWQKGDSNDGYFVNVNGTDDEYYYWNAGLALTVEKIYLRLPLLGYEHRRRRCRSFCAARISATSASCSPPRSCCPKVAPGETL